MLAFFNPRTHSHIMTTVTYRHLIAGSVVHFQKRVPDAKDNPQPVKTLTFGGPKGGSGFYETPDADEIAFLDALANNPQVQVFRVEAPLEKAIDELSKAPTVKQDLAAEQVVQEIQDRAGAVVDPQVSAAHNNLATLIASAKASAAAK